MDGKTDGTRGPGEPFIEIAQDDHGWHWLLWSGNGRAVARNAAPYQSKKHCLQAIKLLPGIWASVKIVAAAGEATNPR